MTVEEWRELVVQLWGSQPDKWRAVCPSCGHVASVAECRAADMPGGAVFFSCIGRWSDGEVSEMLAGGQPCNYAGGGLIGLNPWKVGGRHIFALACPGCGERAARRDCGYLCQVCVERLADTQGSLTDVLARIRLGVVQPSEVKGGHHA